MVYSLLYTFVLLLALPFVLLKGSLRKKYLPTLGERLGFNLDHLNPERCPSIWLHTVSVGEAIAARSLVRQLKNRYPDRPVYVSTTTLTGRAIARQQLQADGVFAFPLDWKWCVRRAAGTLNVSQILVMETEIWPNFLRAAHQKAVPVTLVNGRISDRSFHRYRRFRFFFGPLLRRFVNICAQSEEDARRLVAIGANPVDVHVTGNLKYSEITPPDPQLLKKLAELICRDHRPLFVAGSTHEGEEEAIIAAWQRCLESEPELRLILAPRKTGRFDVVARMLQNREITFGRLSREKPVDAPVILADTIGMLSGLYHFARFAFVGGSLVDRGGHNLLEVTAAGIPVLHGPHMSNFRDIAATVDDAGAGLEVADGQALADACLHLLTSAEAQQQTASAARKVIASAGKALENTLHHIDRAQAWKGVRYGPPGWMKALAWLHRQGAALIRKAPEQELKYAERLKVPVVSVGGLSFGGSAKTPMVDHLARQYLSAGRTPALITRGYGGSGREPLIVGTGSGPAVDAQQAGDEPVMLLQRNPGLIGVKDSDRIRGARLAIDQLGADLLLLDDGFQHRRLARDLNLLMLDADSIVGPRWAGQLLREPLRFAATADAIILFGMEKQRARAARSRLQKRFPDIPVYDAYMVAEGAHSLGSRAQVTLEQLSATPLLALCGIAIPPRFSDTLIRGQLRVSGLKAYPDHHQFTAGDVSDIAAALRASGAGAIITTEKDEQRLLGLSLEEKISTNIYVLRVRLQIEKDEELLAMLP